MACSLSEVTAWCNETLRINEIEDLPGARNGLQVENASGQVSKVVAAVDAHLGVIEAAVQRGADLLIAHHGLFWGPIVPLTGSNFRKYKLAFDNSLAVYGAHLPLDAHPTLGNNARLAQGMGLDLAAAQPFFYERGTWLGFRFEVDWSREETAERVSQATGAPALGILPGGPERVRKLGICSGGCGGEVPKVVAEGIDTLVTGEAPNHAYGLACELGVNVVLGGHYATETFGVKALASEIATRFGCDWEFIDIPTGL